MDDSQDARPRWLRPTLWATAVVLSVLGVILAVVSASPWPLVAFAGLAVPLIPVGRAVRRDASSAR